LGASGQDYLNYTTGDLLSFPVRNAVLPNCLKFLRKALERSITIGPGNIFYHWFKKYMEWQAAMPAVSVLSLLVPRCTAL
jgi:hypothetical protein